MCMTRPVPHRIAGQGRAITATERCAPVRARGMGREEKRPLRRRLDAPKAAGWDLWGGASERLPGCSAGPSGPSSGLESDRPPAPRRRPQAPSSAAVCSCPYLGRRLDHAALPPPGSPPTSRGAHSRLAASSRGPHAWVQMQVQCTPGRQLSGRASRLNFASSSEKPSRPTRCSRQRVARASLPIVPGRNAANGWNSQLPRPPEQP